MKFFWIFILWILVLLTPHFSQAANFTVIDTGGNDCSSSGTTNCTLQSALTQAQNNNEDNTVTLAAGTYTGPFTYNKTATQNSLTIVGHNTDIENPDTFLSATEDIALSITSAFAVEVSHIRFQNSLTGLEIIVQGYNIDSENLNTINIHDCSFMSNSRGLSVSGSNSNFSWTGNLLLTDNLFDGNSSASLEGVGAYVQMVSVDAFPVTVTGNTFSNNQASGSNKSGAGLLIDLYGDHSIITIQENTFTGNTATGDGGGFYAFTHSAFSDDSPIYIVDNEMSGNIGGAGGAFSTYTETAGSPIEITDNNFQNNLSNDTHGGAVKVSSAFGLTFENNTFTNNQTTVDGGAALVLINGDDSNTFSNSISNNTFTGNITNTGNGGSLYVDMNCACNLSLNANLFSENTSAGSGGGGMINFNSGGGSTSPVSPITFTNNIIVNNGTENDGAGFNLTFIGIRGYSLNLVNNTFYGNISSSNSDVGGGLDLTLAQSGQTYNIYNNIFWENESGSGTSDFFSSNPAGNTLTLNNNNFESACIETGMLPWCVGDASPPAAVSAANNINEDPLFSDSSDIPTGFRLYETSPAVETGDAAAPSVPSSDYANVSLTNPPSMGAYQTTIGVPSLEISPSSKDYGNVELGSSNPQSFILTNNGNSSLSVSSISLSDTENFSLDLGVFTPCSLSGNSGDVHGCDASADCGSTPTLAPSQSCTIIVTFSPQNAQSISANLLISSNDFSSPSSIALSGSGNSDSCTPELALTLTAPSEEIEVGQNINFTIQISNNGACESESTTLNMEFSNNMAFQSGGLNTSISSNFLKAIRLNNSSMTCSGSSASASCSLGTLSANSSTSINIETLVTNIGSLMFTANVTNQAGTSTASAIATARVTEANLQGSCILSKAKTSDLNNFSTYLVIALLMSLYWVRQKNYHMNVSDTCLTPKITNPPNQNR